MSTYFYYECMDHDPPLRSADEVGQRYRHLPYIKRWLRDRAFFAKAWSEGWVPEGYFDKSAARFLAQHPTCTVRIITEYGEVIPQEADDE